MQALADTTRLVADGIIASGQAKIIEARARETMVYLAINALLCTGILAATGGLIAWLKDPAPVAVTGALFLGAGALVLVYGSKLYGMFGGAAALIGSGLLIGGASLELMTNHADIAGSVMTVSGIVFALAAARIFKVERNSARFVVGAILLMGLAMHLVGVSFLMDQAKLTGAPIGLFYVYAAALVALAGWFTDVRLVTALAIIPFAQALNTGTVYSDAIYVFYSPEPTLSIVQMAALILGCLWLANHRPERTGRHARILAVMAFIVANLCALVGSLWGDFIGQSFWETQLEPDLDWQEIETARQAYRETAVFISSDLYSILWAATLALLIFWSANKAQRGLFNASITFAGIHAYTQFFETYSDEPLAFVIGGLALIPFAWGMRQLDRWIVAQQESPK